MSKHQPQHALSYARPRQPQQKEPNPWRLTPVGVLTLVAVVAVASALLISWLRAQRDNTNRPLCPTHLRQIGQAIFLYTSDHPGKYAASIADLLPYVSTDVFVCPPSGDTPAKPGPTTQATVSNIQSGGHLSFVILFCETPNPPTADRVLAYEPLSNHQNQGTNVLYADGHVDFVEAGLAKFLITEVTSGHNPPRPFATTPSPSTTPTTIPR